MLFEPTTPDAALLDELVAVLAPAPAGLRRWTVMNAIRRNRRAAGRDIPLKMEAESNAPSAASAPPMAQRATPTARPLPPPGPKPPAKSGP